MAQRITKQDLVNELQLQDIFSGQPKYKIQEFVEDFFQNITDKVANGDSVAIPGFGKFENYERQNGTKTPKFRPAKAFKESVAK